MYGVDHIRRTRARDAITIASGTSVNTMKDRNDRDYWWEKQLALASW